jgi:hypothetical protein
MKQPTEPRLTMAPNPYRRSFDYDEVVNVGTTTCFCGANVKIYVVPDKSIVECCVSPHYDRKRKPCVHSGTPLEGVKVRVWPLKNNPEKVYVESFILDYVKGYHE